MRVVAIGLMIVCSVCWGQETGEVQSQSTLALEPVGPKETEFVWHGVGTEPRTEMKTEAQRIHELRVKKCERLWATFAPWSYDPALCEWHVTCHEEAGIGWLWYYSWIYYMGNFRCGVGRTAPGMCYGPADVKWPYCVQPPVSVLGDRAWNRHALLDPRVNIWCHTNQMSDYHRKTGRDGFMLLRTVFYPAAPRGNACNSWAPIWERWDRKARACLAEGYRVGKIN